MSENAPSQTGADESGQAGPTAGQLLRRAREASGLHVAALAVSLKVPVRKLEDLEGDRHDRLTDSVFVRALASSVCRSLKIDPAPILERLPRQASPRLIATSDGINQPFRAPSDGAAPNWLDQLTRPVFLAVFALLLGALVLVLLPTMQREQAASPSASRSPVTAVSAPAPAKDAASAEGGGSTSTPGMVETIVLPQPPAATASMPVAESAPATVVAGSKPAESGGLLSVRAKAPSWVEITDAKGAAPVRKILAAGEVATANGPPPLQVTIGRADATEVQVRGKPFDLGAVSRENVARFEVR